MASISPVSLGFAILAIYLVIVRSLRYRRLGEIQALLGSKRLEDMAPALAQKIIHVSLFYETPTIMLLGTQVALFKVWAIPTVAKVLLDAGELKSPHSMSKRLVDTATLVSTWVTNPLVGPGSGAEPYEEGCYNEVDPRGALAIARVKWLHRKYPIRMGDYRYNLALFVLEPNRWAERLDWRPHSAIEKHAFFIFWMEIGRRMGIEDLWATYEDMEQWAEEYELDNMTPNSYSIDIVNIGIPHYSRTMPRVPILQKVVLYIVSYFLDSRARRAMQLPDPPPWIIFVIKLIWKLRSLTICHLCLPRRKPAMWVSTFDPDLEFLAKLPEGALPRLHAVFRRKRSGPWYYPESTGLRKKTERLLVWLGVVDSSSLPGKRWKSEGYRIEEMGPTRFENSGHDEVLKEAQSIQGQPVTGPWSPSWKKPTLTRG